MVIEVYNEDVRDLLASSSSMTNNNKRSGSISCLSGGTTNLAVRENPRRDIFVNAVKHKVKSSILFFVVVNLPYSLSNDFHCWFFDKNANILIVPI